MKDRKFILIVVAIFAIIIGIIYGIRQSQHNEAVKHAEEALKADQDSIKKFDSVYSVDSAVMSNEHKKK